MGIDGIVRTSYSYTDSVPVSQAAPTQDVRRAPQVATPEISSVQQPESGQVHAQPAAAPPGRVVSEQTQTESTAASQAAEKSDRSYEQVMVQKAADHMKDRLRTMGKEAVFGFNDDIDRFTITIIDKDSKQVVKEIPSEQTQKMIEHFQTLRGMMVDEGV